MLHQSGNWINIEDEEKSEREKDKLIIIGIVWVLNQAEPWNPWLFISQANKFSLGAHLIWINFSYLLPQESYVIKRV